MMSSPDEQAALQQASALEHRLQAVEDALTALGHALHQQNSHAVDGAASQLHAALAAAVDHFGRAARSGGVPPLLRRRFAQAGGQVAAQREALARATASLDRAIDVLLPRTSAQSPGLYTAGGAAARGGSSGSLIA